MLREQPEVGDEHETACDACFIVVRVDPFWIVIVFIRLAIFFRARTHTFGGEEEEAARAVGIGDVCAAQLRREIEDAVVGLVVVLFCDGQHLASDAGDVFLIEEPALAEVLRFEIALGQRDEVIYLPGRHTSQRVADVAVPA